MSRVLRRIRALHFGLTTPFFGHNRAIGGAGWWPGSVRDARLEMDQVSRMCRAGDRRAGTASTMMQSASIANTMNSNASAPTPIFQQNEKFEGEPLTVC